jgi:hypothetical protein
MTGLKGQEEEEAAQTKIDSVTEVTGASGILEHGKVSAEYEDNFSGAKKCDIPVTADTGQKNSVDCSGKMMLRVLPSHGEPCEGSNSAGGDCGFASEHCLIGSKSQRSVWCSTHLRKILSGYDQNQYAIIYQPSDGENQ